MSMKCHEVRPLSGAYLDSELDVRTTQEIKAHLDHCPACASFFASNAAFNASLGQALARGEATPALWRGIESSVRAGFATDHPAPVKRMPQATPSFWRELLWPGPRYYLALAAVWVLLLSLNSMGHRTDAPRITMNPQPPEVRTALAQQRQIYRELLAPVQEANASASNTRPSPRSQLVSTLSNT